MKKNSKGHVTFTLDFGFFSVCAFLRISGLLNGSAPASSPFGN